MGNTQKMRGTLGCAMFRHGEKLEEKMKMEEYYSPD
jgi:hypothetical protein